METGNTTNLRQQELEAKIAELDEENKLLKSLLQNSQNDQKEGNLQAEGQKRFRTVFEESPYGNKIISSDLRILKVNYALTQLLGYQEEEIVGRRIAEFTSANYREHWAELQKNLWNRNLPSFSLETCLIKKDGSTFNCRVTSILFEDNGTTLGYTILEDISPRILLEKERKALSDKKDEFISIVSHELRTPLTNIKAYNQLLERSVSPNEKYHFFISKSNEHIERLERLTADLLDVTKITSGRIQLNITEFNFNEVLAHSIESVQQVSPQHKIILESGSDIRYKGDEFRLEQVVINLLSNAVKYSPNGDCVILRSEVYQDNILVSIQDFGIGIEKEQIGKLFDRFYRVDNTAMLYQGTGLGLYIVSEILKRHNGSFWIESEMGKGSTFYFRLPLIKDESVVTKNDNEFFEDQTIRIEYIADKGWLEVDWLGFQTFDSVKRGCLMMMERLKTTGCNKVLNSNRRLQGTWSEAADWVGQEWFPMMEAAGLKSFAWVYSLNKFSQLSADKSLAVKVGNVETKTFYDLDEAKRWLCSGE